MKKTFVSLLLFLVFTQSFAQVQRKFSAYVSGGYSQTIYDRTKANNLWGVEAGLQTFYNSKSNFKPSIELTYTTAFLDDLVYRMNPDGSQILSVSSMVNLLAAVAFQPAKNMYLSFATGPGFINGQTLLVVKPSLGFYFAKNKKWVAKVAFINVFNRDKTTNDDFGSLSLAIGIRLF